ncbi:hypothetical protein BD779DRAFT_1678678 [Infundibulicybe gibba]|nr:hypothetical protein BD779DRAFT_1678678 [Infundibulicybe gibba]
MMLTDVNLSDARDIRINDYLLIFSLVFSYYDHFITIDREVKYLWTRPKKPSTYWFLANRYFFFSVGIIVALFQFMPPKSPKRSGVFFNNDLISQMASSKLRELQSITADSRGGKPALSIRTDDLAGICTIWMLVLAWLVYEYFISFGQLTPLLPQWALSPGHKTTATHLTFSCQVGLSYETSKRLGMAWAAMFAYDSIVFALTLIKTWRAARNIEIRARRLPMSTLLLRDGAIYFAVMALANLANILTFYARTPLLWIPLNH